MVDKKKIAAASAVISYMKQEEEIACAVAVQSRTATPLSQMPIPAAPLKMWGLSGRQTQMQLRNMMQLKTFHRKI